MNVPGAIVSRRLALGWTQAELARRALLARPNLSAIESGRRDLTVGTLARIARALGTAPASLLEPAGGLRTRAGRVPVDTVALAVVSGRREFDALTHRLADGLAWRCRPSLAACGAPGTRRGSRTAWNRCRLEWDAKFLELVEGKVRKFLSSDAGAASRPT